MKLGTTLRTIESSQGCWNETLTGSFLQGAEVCTFVPSLYAMREVMPVMPATRAAGDSLRVRRVALDLYPWFNQEVLRRRDLDHPTNLEPKGKGEKSMLWKAAIR
jgi:hypothetical protein